TREFPLGFSLDEVRVIENPPCFELEHPAQGQDDIETWTSAPMKVSLPLGGRIEHVCIYAECANVKRGSHEEGSHFEEGGVQRPRGSRRKDARGHGGLCPSSRRQQAHQARNHQGTHHL